MRSEIFLATLQMKKIRTDGGTQLRVETDQALVAKYAAVEKHYIARRKEDPKFPKHFPPVIVFREGATDWLAHGHHRFESRLLLGLKCIEAEVHIGTLRDAILYAAGANAENAKDLQPGDERKIIMTLLSDPEWSRWPNTKIADYCGVSEHRVRLVVNEVHSTGSNVRTIIVTSKNGKTYERQTRKRVTDLPPQEQADKINREEYAAELELVRARIRADLERNYERANDYAELAPLAAAIRRAVMLA